MGQRIVFRHENALRWFDTDQAEFESSAEMAGPHATYMLEHLALLPGGQWVLYHTPDVWLDSGRRLSSVHFFTEGQAVEWLLARDREVPPCLEVELNERAIVKPNDKPNENLLRVWDDDTRAMTVVDVTGASQWGPHHTTEGYSPLEEMPDYFIVEYVYRLASGQFILHSEKTHRECETSCGPCVSRMYDEAAAQWLLLSGFEPPADIDHHADTIRFKDHVAPAARPAGNEEVAENTIDLRATYSDPDNFERDKWFYESRKDGMKNADVLESLKAHSEFNQIETENALRSAIKQIARHCGLPILNGTAGRPRTTV